MRILLAHNSPYYPAHGGGDKSNRLLMEALAARGHACRVVARTGGYGEEEHARFLAGLAAHSVPVRSAEQGVVAFERHGVDVHTVTSHPNLRAYFSAQIEEFLPDVILSSTDDPAQLLLTAALGSSARVVYLARATLALPFGPDCAFPSEEKTSQLRHADAVVGVSEYVASYIRRHSGIPAVHVPISLMDQGPWPALGHFDNEFVTMVNPCAVKGIAIFLGLAAALPEVQFAAVPTWGTNTEDLAALEAQPNVRLLEPADDIDDILRRTRVLLVPSLWAEARSRIVVEAMLRGVPVMASNVGGIPEAKLGVDYLLPVRPIEKYLPQVDEKMVPVASVPEQDIAPWSQALAALLGDRGLYERLASQSRETALVYAGSLSVVPFEQVLSAVLGRPKASTAGEPPRVHPASPLGSLSPEKRALLALRLRKKSAHPAAAADAWFPTAAGHPTARLRLFLFPYAGAGISPFSRWQDLLPAALSLCPARLPGRETRIWEPPFEEMGPLIDALADAIEPYLKRPFAFFGHSMGAGVAFELARELRRRGQPLPARVLVSAAKGASLRRDAPTEGEPTDAELVAQLRQLEGVAPEVIENPELMRIIMPALRADTKLYRRYVYRPEPPLACPIHAFGGAADPNIRPEHLQAWQHETSSGFTLQLFPGGHFYFRESLPAFLAAVEAAIQSSM